MKIGWRLCWALAGLLLAGAAHAADADAQRKGEALLKEGLAATKRGNYERARAAFLQAATLIPRGQVWRNLGLAEMKLGDPVAALKHYRIAASAADLDPEKRSVLQQNIQDAYAATGHIEVLANEGAAVTVDGLSVEDAASERIDVLPGKHVVEASAGPGATRTARAEVDAGPNKLVTADVRVVAEPPPPARGSEPPAGGGSVANGGPIAGSAPNAGGGPLASGGPSADHAPVAIERPPQGDIILPSTAGTPFWTTRRSLGVAFGSAGVVSLGVAAFFFTQVDSDKNTASALTSGASRSACAGSSPASTCAALEDAYSSQRTNANFTLAFLGLGSAALVTGAVLWFWPSPASSAPTVGPLVVPRGAGLALRGDL
jgi:hypothetical protein